METRHEFTHVIIEEYFSKDETGVYKHWRFPNGGEWHKELTAFNEIPWIEIKQ